MSVQHFTVAVEIDDERLATTSLLPSDPAAWTIVDLRTAIGPLFGWEATVVSHEDVDLWYEISGFLGAER